MRSARSVLLLLSAALGGCLPDVATGRTALLERDRAFNRETAERGVEAWVSFFAEDGAMIQAGVGEIRGHDAIREAMVGVLGEEGTVLVWEPLRAEVAASGELGYTVGRYEYSAPGPEDEPLMQQGLYVTIWQKDAAGQWKVALDIGNPVEAL